MPSLLPWCKNYIKQDNPGNYDFREVRYWLVNWRHVIIKNFNHKTGLCTVYFCTAHFILLFVLIWIASDCPRTSFCPETKGGYCFVNFRLKCGVVTWQYWRAIDIIPVFLGSKSFIWNIQVVHFLAQFGGIIRPPKLPSDYTHLMTNGSWFSSSVIMI